MFNYTIDEYIEKFQTGNLLDWRGKFYLQYILFLDNAGDVIEPEQKENLEEPFDRVLEFIDNSEKESNIAFSNKELMNNEKITPEFIINIFEQVEALKSLVESKMNDT